MEHLNHRDQLLIRLGLVDSDGRPSAGREGLTDAGALERLRLRIAGCDHCRTLAHGLSAERRHDTPAASDADHEFFRKRLLERRHRRARWMAAAASVAILPAAALTLYASGWNSLHAWQGAKPLFVGDQVVANEGDTTIVIMAGFRPSGEIRLARASTIALDANQDQAQEWRLLGGHARVKLASAADVQALRVRVGELVTEAAPVWTAAARLPQPASDVEFSVEAESAGVTAELSDANHAPPPSGLPLHYASAGGDAEPLDEEPRSILISVLDGAVHCSRDRDRSRPMLVKLGERVSVMGPAKIMRLHGAHQ